MKINKENIITFLKFYDDLVDIAIELSTINTPYTKDTFNGVQVDDDGITIEHRWMSFDPNYFHVGYDDIVKHVDKNEK